MADVIVIKEGIEIPEGILCTFGRKVERGVHYFVGYRKDKVVHVHFSSNKYELSEMISYQPVLNLAGRQIKK